MTESKELIELADRLLSLADVELILGRTYNCKVMREAEAALRLAASKPVAGDGEVVAWRMRFKGFDELTVNKERADRYREYVRVEPLVVAATQSPDRADVGRHGVCCYCDAALSCACCGREQPSDQPLPPASGFRDGIEAAVDAEREACATIADLYAYQYDATAICSPVTEQVIALRAKEQAANAIAAAIRRRAQSGEV